MSRRLALAVAVAVALALAGVAVEWGEDDEYPCAVAWTATDAEYEAHVACDLALARNPDRRMP